jgi:cell wall-associated protease
MIGVWARSADNSNDAAENGALQIVSFTITAGSAPPLALTGLITDKGSPQPLGTTVNFTAIASGGTAPLQYKWFASSNSGVSWTVLQDWATGNTFGWTPAAAGGYMIGVWARSADNGNDAAENGALQIVSFTITTAAVSSAQPPQFGGQAHRPFPTSMRH